MLLRTVSETVKMQLPGLLKFLNKKKLYMRKQLILSTINNISFTFVVVLF